MYSLATFSVAGGSVAVPHPSLGVAFPPPLVLVSLPLDALPPAPPVVVAVVAVAVVVPPVVALVLELPLEEDELLAEPAVALVVDAPDVVLVETAWVATAVPLVVAPPTVEAVVLDCVVLVLFDVYVGSDSLHAGSVIGSAAKSALAIDF